MKKALVAISDEGLLQFVLSGWQDSNLRPSAPKADALTGLRYTPSPKQDGKVRDFYWNDKTEKLIACILTW